MGGSGGSKEEGVAIAMWKHWISRKGRDEIEKKN